MTRITTTPQLGNRRQTRWNGMELPKRPNIVRMHMPLKINLPGKEDAVIEGANSSSPMPRKCLLVALSIERGAFDSASDATSSYDTK